MKERSKGIIQKTIRKSLILNSILNEDQLKWVIIEELERNGYQKEARMLLEESEAVFQSLKEEPN